MKKLKSKEPSRSRLILTAGSGLVLGALLGVSILLSRPVNTVSRQPEAEELEEPGNYATYFTPGREGGSETPNLRTAVSRIERRTPGPVSFSEEEINYFFNQFKAEEAEPAEGEEAAEPGAQFSQFNVRIDGDQLFASIKLVMDPQGDRFEILALAKLGFENSDAGPQLQVRELRLNSLPVPSLGGVVTSMIESRIAQMPWPEEFVEMWQNIRKIELESDALIVEVGLRRA